LLISNLAVKFPIVRSSSIALHLRYPTVTMAAVALLFGSMAPAAPAATVAHPTSSSVSTLVRRRFFGIVPQSEFGARDVARMRAGGIRSVRLSLAWAAIQPEQGEGFQWAAFDRAVALTARARMEVLPFLAGSPPWIGAATTLPVGNRIQRSAWSAFLRAAVRRYGPGGRFWQIHSATSPEPLPTVPIRRWQIWNEPNFFYFASPISPRRYGRLVEISHHAITSVDPGAKIILAGLFGHPEQPRGKGLPATRFLAGLYQAVPDLSRVAAGIALHPYAADVRDLEELTTAVRRVATKHEDPSMPLYITEMGWGSQPDPRVVSFERGPRGQARDLTRAYRYLLRRRRQLHLRQVYWFSWKDNPSTCDFCDSTGLFADGPGFRGKPAWRAFVRITGGKSRPS
jgi:Beta-galactosidase